MTSANEKTAQVYDAAQRALAFAHRLLETHPEGDIPLGELLNGLAGTFAAAGAGLADLAEGTFVSRSQTPGSLPADWPCRWPWQGKPEVLEAVRNHSTAVTLPVAEGGSILATAIRSDRGSWLLWLEARGSRQWSDAEGAALALAGQALARRLGDGRHVPHWARQLEHASSQRRLEEMADVVRRLAHDFSNVLTGIFGFAELAQAHVEDNPVARQYVQEIQEAAQLGGEWVRQLRTFTRRQSVRSGSCLLSHVLTDDSHGRHGRGASTGLAVAIPAELPALAVEPDALHELLTCLLDNAREATPCEGRVTLSARALDLSPADCLELFGAATPGPAVEIRITDTGRGLRDEVRRRLFHELFYSDKPRHRGMGLAVVYGIVQAFRGGFRLEPNPDGGTIVRVFLPQAPTPPPARRPAADRPRGDRVLVVDDDPLILQLICAALERAGFRTQSATGGAEALSHYVEAAEDPFRLVLTDLLMPEITGSELARRLVAADATVNVLFMSGQIADGVEPPELGDCDFDLLPKPFRADGLLRAVRAALERGRRRALAATAGT